MNREGRAQTIGNYRILREIGSGGMGVVYLAQHQVIGRYAAIKLLLPEFSRNQEMVQRIFNEARMTALIRHPGLVDVYDFGQLPNGSAYVVMEYLEGETLTSMLARLGRLPTTLAVTLARQIAAAVGAAHEKGIVHRDLKPDNVYIVRDDDIDAGVRARILDFGIAKLSAELQGGAARTRTGSIMGTPLYMSPEQCRGAGTVDWRTDVYSLGCILFEMLTGERPFPFEGVGEIIAAHLQMPPPRPSSVEGAVPGWLDAVVSKALAKKVEARHQSMEELALALGGRKRAKSAVQLRPGESVPKVPTTFSKSAGQVGRSSIIQRRPTMVATVLAGLVAVLGVVLALATRGGGVASQPARSRAASAPAAVETPPPPALPPVAVPVLPDAALVAPPPPPPAVVVLTIRSIPDAADVLSASGEKIGVTPFDLGLASSPVTVTLRHAGYAPKRVTFDADEGGEQVVRLMKTAPPPVPAKKKKGGRDVVDPFEE